MTGDRRADEEMKSAGLFICVVFVCSCCVPLVSADNNFIVAVNEDVNLSFTHINLGTGLPFAGYTSELVKWDGISWDTSPVVGSDITDANGRDFFTITEQIPGTYSYKCHLPAVYNSWSNSITVDVYSSPVVASISRCSIIGSPGFYSLGNDIHSNDADTCFLIRSPDVLFDGMGYTVQGTVIDDSTMANGIYVRQYPDGKKLTNVSIQNVTLGNWSHGIGFYNSDGKISHTRAFRNYFDGIRVEGSESLIIENNTASDGIYRGFGITASENILFLNNTAAGNVGKDGKGGLGVRIDNSTQITVKNNNFLENYGTGAVLLNTSSTLMSGNRIIHNGDGVALIDSSSNNFMQNRIENNKYHGISLGSSDRNSFSDNYLNNSHNVDTDSANWWNGTRRAGPNIAGGPSMGGNYWARPDGTGFSQSCTDQTHDGICDSAYSLDLVNTDYLPLSSFVIFPLPGYAKLPTDPDGDGIYEDLNGNGRLDFADVVLYFNQMTWIAANEPIAAFDLNGNGRIDFADIVALFNEI
jgi:parallel beta-helix repeat protein